MMLFATVMVLGCGDDKDDDWDTAFLGPMGGEGEGEDDTGSEGEGEDDTGGEGEGE